jgi:hypothetical protein
MYQHVRLLLKSRTEVTCSMLYSQQYLFTVVINKIQMCSPQFNLTRMFLSSFVACFLGLMRFLHLLVNCLRVVWIDCLYAYRVCFDCVSHQWCTVGMYCVSAASEWPWFERKRSFFSIFFALKMNSRNKINKKTVLVSPDVNLTTVVICQVPLTWQLTSVPDN